MELLLGCSCACAMLKCLRVIKCKMNAVVAIALFSVFLGVCECTNVQNATLTMLPEAVKTVSQVAVITTIKNNGSLLVRY